MAGRPPHMVSSRLRRILRRRIPQANYAGTKSELRRTDRRLQVLEGLSMNRFSDTTQIAGRILISAVFLLNGFGIIDQTIPARELLAMGAPAALVPIMMFVGRIIEIL